MAINPRTTPCTVDGIFLGNQLSATILFITGGIPSSSSYKSERSTIIDINNDIYNPL